jgi:hypothetical protein
MYAVFVSLPTSFYVLSFLFLSLLLCSVVSISVFRISFCFRLFWHLLVSALHIFVFALSFYVTGAVSEFCSEE